MKRLGLLVLTTSSAIADPIDPPVPGDAVPLAGTVLAWNDATFYVDATDKADTLKLGSLGSRKQSAGQVVPLKVVGTRGAFVEVEPADYDCTSTRLVQPKDFTKLRLFVRRGDLAPVVVKPFAKTYPNGTSVIVRPGLPALPDSRGVYHVPFERGGLVVAIPTASIAYAYKFGGVAVKRPDGKFLVDAKAPATLGAATFELGEDLAVPAVDKRGATSFVSLKSECLDAKISVPSDKISEGGIGVGIGVGGGGRGHKLGERWVIPIGTPMFTASLERQIAVTAAVIEVPKPDKPTVCVTRPVSFEQLPYARALAKPKTAPALTLCVAADKVIHVNDAPARP
jgi:hypothetical protein